MNPTVKVILDLRDVTPSERHAQIANDFQQLSAGEAILLVNDRDPKPLFIQFRSTVGETFFWDYVETGPEVWQVQIGLAMTRCS
jgi:uncharacterized protein (DUF2249 family)